MKCVANGEDQSQLLLAMVACQIGLVDRSALIAALNQWQDREHKSLGEIIAQQANWSAEQFAHVQVIAAERLDACQHDASKALDAIEIDRWSREDLGKIVDPALRADLARLGSDRATPADDPSRTVSREPCVLPREPCVLPPGSVPAMPSSDLYATIAPLKPLPTTSQCRFQILRPHAAGGRGEVDEALDKQLDRVVALKRIKSEYADDDRVRAHFVREARITGWLEHPSVVPVYALEDFPDGKPYYAMRFIRGDNLEAVIKNFHRGIESIRARHRIRIEFRTLLRHFIDVCHAVEYAHSHGIIHRDLKPLNIMLGTFGETFVVDWGLAQVLGQQAKPGTMPESLLADGPSEDTAASCGSGTPFYMSPEQAAFCMCPEQAAARGVEVGPRSDVYSLGATLFQLLTGEVPFPSTTLSQVLAMVERGEITPPSHLNKRVPLALEAVCLKAMSRDVEARYASVAELREDIEHWLADEPTSAYRERPWHRLARLVRRHSSGSLLAIVLLLAGVIASLALILASEVRSAHESSRSLKEASRVLRKVFLDLSSEGLEDKPELQVVRTQLCNYYTAYLQSHLDDASKEVQFEKAQTLETMAEITQSIAKKSDAQGYYEQAQRVYLALLVDEPDNAAYRDYLGEDYLQRGKLLVDDGNWDEADKQFQLAIDVLQAAVNADPKEWEFKKDLADAHHARGVMLLRRADCRTESSHDQELALAAFNQALAIRQDITKRVSNPQDRLRYESDLATSWGYIGDVKLRQSQFAEAWRAYQQSEQIRERLPAEVIRLKNDIQLGQLDDEPPLTLTAARCQLAQSYQNTGLLFSSLGTSTVPKEFNMTGLDEVGQSPAECAILAFKRALELQQQAHTDEPANIEIQNDLVHTQNKLAALQIDMGQVPDMNVLRDTYLVCAQLVKSNADDIYFRDSLLSSEINLAVLQSQHSGGDNNWVAKGFNDLRQLQETKGFSAPEDLYHQAELQALARQNDESVATLRAALGRGYNNWGRIRRDHALDALRAREDFARLMKEFRISQAP